MAHPKPLPPFKLERFFAQHEFTAQHLLCCSDCEPLLLSELLQLADADALDRWRSLRLGYTETRGLPALREAIAQLYTRVSADDVLVLAPEEGIYLTMLALLKPGDHVVAMLPGYQSLYECARGQGAQVSFWEPTTGTDGRQRFDVDRLQALVTPHTKLVVVNAPHNPTGWLPSPAEWEQLVDVCRRHGTTLFSDEMYRFTELDGAERLDNAADVYEGAISLCGVSKSWGLPGLRIGWLAHAPRNTAAPCTSASSAGGMGAAGAGATAPAAAGLLDRVAELKDFTTICSSAPSEVLALIAVRATAVLTQRSRDIIAANLDDLDAFFGRWRHVFGWSPPDAGPVAFPRLLVPGISIDEFCACLVREAGVLLLPASVYDHPASVEQGRFRFGLGRRSMRAGLQALEAWLTTHYPAPVGNAETTPPR